MPRFTFSLDPVLRQRQATEDQCQRDLAKTLRQRMIMHQQLRQMQQTISQSKHELKGSLIGRVDLAQTAGFAQYSSQVSQRARAFVSRLAVLEKQVDTAREKLIQATRARQALEKLRDRQQRQWRREQNRREEAQLDDIATGLAARRIMAGQLA